VVVEEEKAAATGGKAAFGSQVKLRDEESGKEVTYRLVGATEANLSDGKLSIESPVAQAMVGRKAGDNVVVSTPRGGRAYTVIAVD
jgi:transcription elongation factor GreA